MNAVTNWVLSARAELVLRRLVREEGEEFYPYDDKTGHRVRAPEGNISWGRGYNLEQCGSKTLFDAMDRVLIADVEQQLWKYDWYHKGTDTQGSVLLDVAFNAGVHGLLNFPHMIAAYDKEDWAEASKQCAVKNEQLNDSRYAPLRKLLLPEVK